MSSSSSTASPKPLSPQEIQNMKELPSKYEKSINHKCEYAQELLPVDTEKFYFCGINTQLNMESPVVKSYLRCKRFLACDILNLKNHMDLRTLFIVGLFHFSWYYRVKNGPDYFRVPFDFFWLFWLCLNCWFCATITHNCIHNQPFRNYHVNTVWNIILAHSYGWPVTCLVPGHNLSHHKYTNTPLDAQRTTRMQYKNNFLNYFLYPVLHQAQVIKMDLLYFARSADRGNIWPSIRLRIEQFSFYPVQIYCLYTYGFQFVWIMVVPQLCSKLGLIGMNMLQHDGCLIQKSLGQTPDEYIAKGSHTEITLKQRRERGEDNHIDVANFLRTGEEKNAPTDEELKNLVFKEGCQKDIEGEMLEKKESSQKTFESQKRKSETEDNKATESEQLSPASSRSPSDTGSDNNSSNQSTTASDTDSPVMKNRSNKKAVEHKIDENTESNNPDDSARPEGEELDNLWDPDFNFARDFVGDILNWWVCNNGYHTIHHMRPSMHWSLYANAHRDCIAMKQHPCLAKKNIVAYVWDTVFMGQRQTWDGRKYST